MARRRTRTRYLQIVWVENRIRGVKLMLFIESYAHVKSLVIIEDKYSHRICAIYRNVEIYVRINLILFLYIKNLKKISYLSNLYYSIE